MHFKQLSVLALAGHAFAQQTPTLAQALNATAELSQLSTVLGLVPELVQALSSAQNITILAPSNSAFGRVPNATLQGLTSNTGILSALLQYHVLNGTYRAAQITNSSAFVPTLLTNPLFANVTGGQRVRAIQSNGKVSFFSGLLDNSTVSTADVNFTGGVIHIIDHVLTLPESASKTAVAAGLTSLAGALNATNLTSTVDNLRDVTIFAPANAAFQAIGSGLANLSAADTTNILTYHVVPGVVGYSSGLQNGTVIPTVNGQNLTITINNGSVFVNNAKVVIPDVLIAGGVVHVIDAVLNPSNRTIVNPTASAGAPAFSGASSATNAPFTSGVPTPSRSVAAAGPSASGSSPVGSAGAAPKQTAAVGAILGLGAAMVHFL
ncbi:Fasciclin-domain-containing protein [Ophiobolus disseminans]|uniref:Fasciclin-domain-containing protein n=1 Tax=Ophiobolus disseminans TaxID=1469910 RepID=A0A6A7A754_9PLEO|nr:Fasciclin-domain-containing protein [Ophiobolus disseminans]